MAIVPRCAWCSTAKKDLHSALIVFKNLKLVRRLGFTDKWIKNDGDSLWTACICQQCYEVQGSRFHVDIPSAQYLFDEIHQTEDELSDKVRSDLAMLRLAPPNKHIQGVGIRVGDRFEIVLLED